MKKSNCTAIYCCLPKMNLKMKFALLFFIIVFSQLHANSGYSQNTKISLDLKNVTIKQVFLEIEGKTDFRFFYKSHEINTLRKISIKTKRKSIATILRVLFKDTDHIYEVFDKQIVIRSESVTPNIKPRASISQGPIKITGKVTDQDGNPLSGVTVRIKDTNKGVATNFDGNYTIVVPSSESVLVFTSIGFATREIPVKNQNSINISLIEAVDQLDAVTLNAGYYKTSKRLATGNIGTITAVDIQSQPVTDALQALQGRIPGVEINQTSGFPGDAITVRVRGLNSISLPFGSEARPNANIPLYVIDGVPLFPESLNAGNLGIGFTSPLSFLNPTIIESMSVLKDADATAIYGSRGANGVILITTKKGKEGNTRVDMDYSYGTVTFPKSQRQKIDLLNTEQYLAMRREALVNDGFWPVPPENESRHPDLFAWDQTRNTDWREELLRGVGEQTNARVTLSGGSELTRYTFNANYLKQTNIFNFDEDAAYKSLSGILNVNHSSKNKRFTADLSVNYSSILNTQNAVRLTRMAHTLAPNAPELLNEDGSINFENNTFEELNHPLSEIERTYESDSRNLIGNLRLGYQIVPELTLRALVGFSQSELEELSLQPLSSVAPEQRANRVAIHTAANGNGDTWIFEPQLDYEFKLGNAGTLSGFIGTTLQGSSSERLYVTAFGYDSDVLLRDINAAPDVRISRSNFVEYKYTAAFARINYNLKDRYLLNLTGRRDGSTRFGPGKQWGNFGAIGWGWIFSEENFIKNSWSFLNYGKFRGSYGITGSDAIGDYQFLSTFESTFNPYDGGSGLVTSRAANPNFSWEENEKLEFAVDLALFNNSINFSAAWYNNRTDNQLIGRPLSIVTGFTQLQFNLPAVVENTGLEFTLNTRNIQTNEFGWSTDMTFTRARNTLVEFPNIELFSAFANTFEVGRSLNGRKVIGSNGLNPETGLYERIDVNGDGVFNALDQQDFREVFRDFYGGINNRFTYKGFQLDVFFRFVKQNAINYLANFGNGGSFSVNGSNRPVEFLDRWQNPGDITNIQRFGIINNIYRAHFSSSSQLVDASFIRLQNVALTYNLPKDLINNLSLSQARIYVRAQNLFTISPYEGLDPETQGLGLPPLRTITTGVQLSF